MVDASSPTESVAVGVLEGVPLALTEAVGLAVGVPVAVSVRDAEGAKGRMSARKGVKAAP